jgi:hypothetical protein
MLMEGVAETGLNQTTTRGSTRNAMTNCKRTMKLIGMTLLSLGIYCPIASGKTLLVGKPNTPCPNPNYNTIAAAINAASPGDVIEVCPALYPEQLVITQPLTLRGISQNGIPRVLIQPAQLQPVANMPFTAVITIMNASDVTIQNVAIDASNNTIAGCSVALAGIHFYNASGTVDGDAISGTQLSNPLSCTKLFPGNGFGVQIDQDVNWTARLSVAVRNTSIHDFSRNGILAVGANENVDIEGNSIVGVGPSTGVNQFGVFLASGASGRISGNYITQGPCGTIPILDCYNVRSEGVVLRSSGDGTVIDGNTISNVQSGIFVNGFTDTATITHVRVTNNVITNVDALSGIHIQGVASGLFSGNRIFHVGPFTTDTSDDEEGCGINDVSGTASLANTITGNWINDAYCGVGYVTGDQVQGNVFLNTLYEALNGDNYPDGFPPPVEPAQPTTTSTNSSLVLRQLRKVHQ